MITEELDLDAEIKRLITTDLSYTQIAKQLGVSRSAIAGRIYRMRARNEVSRQNKVQFQRAEPANPAIKQSVAKVKSYLKGWKEVVQVPPPPNAKGVHLMDLRESDCRYALYYDEQKGHFFCGEPRRDRGTRYCALHHDIVWRKPKS